MVVGWAILALPGCLTQALWSDDDERQIESIETLSETVETIGGALERLAGGGLAWRADGEQGHWSLRSSADAELVGAILDAPELCTVEEVSLAAEVVTLDGRQLADEVKLRLLVRLDARELMSPLAETELSPAVELALAKPHVSLRSAIGSRAFPSPAVFRECAEALDRGYLAAAMQSSAAVVVESHAFVDNAGRPLFLPESPVLGDGSGSGARIDRLRMLQRTGLIVRIRGADGLRTYRVDPARLWLRSRLDASGRSVVHESTWLRAPASGQAGTRLARAECRVRRLALVRVSSDPGGTSLITKIALTPFTLAIDAAFSWLWTLIAGDDDDRPETEQQRLRREHVKETRGW